MPHAYAWDVLPRAIQDALSHRLPQYPERHIDIGIARATFERARAGKLIPLSAALSCTVWYAEKVLDECSTKKT